MTIEEKATALMDALEPIGNALPPLVGNIVLDARKTIQELLETLKAARFAETTLGVISVKPTESKEYPGFWIDIHREEADVDAPLALVEFTGTEVDLEVPAIITRVWDDVTKEEYTTRCIHTGIDEYFEEEDK